MATSEETMGMKLWLRTLFVYKETRGRFSQRRGNAADENKAPLNEK